MNKNERSIELSVFGSYNRSSIGDRMILVSLLDLLFKDFNDDLQVNIICTDPESIVCEFDDFDWANNVTVTELNNGSINKEILQGSDVYRIKHGIKRFIKGLPEPILKIIVIFRLLRKISTLKFHYSSRGLLIGGGNLIMDLFYTWPWKLYFISKQFLRRNIPVFFVGVGALPINTYIGRKLLKIVVKKSRLVFVRDRSSKKFLESEFDTKSQYHPDLALSFPKTMITKTKKNNPNNIIAVNFAPVYSESWPKIDQNRHYQFTAEYANALLTIFNLLQEKPTLLIYNTNLSDEKGSVNFLNYLNNIGIPSEKLIECRKTTVRELLLALADADLAITTRLHAGIIALRAGLPVLAISYQKKVTNVLTDIGLEKCIIRFDEIDKIPSKYLAATRNPFEYKLSKSQENRILSKNRLVIEEIMKSMNCKN